MNEYHILSLSGGKDSTALAFFMKENEPEIWNKLELVFCDTECELPETYDYLNKIEVFLNKKITRIKPEKSFEEFYQIYKFAPSICYRWCTTNMKIIPFRKYISKFIKKNKDSKIHLYIGIRSDEPTRIEKYQSNQISSKNKNIVTHYPLAENNLIKNDVYNILKEQGINIPEYYKWRSRSGCFFCFFQRKIEWINLLKYHPDLYDKALYYEKIGGKHFTWCHDISLNNLKHPEVIQKIKANYAKTKTKNKTIKLYDWLAV